MIRWTRAQLRFLVANATIMHPAAITAALGKLGACVTEAAVRKKLAEFKPARENSTKTDVQLLYRLLERYGIQWPGGVTNLAWRDPKPKGYKSWPFIWELTTKDGQKCPSVLGRVRVNRVVRSRFTIVSRERVRMGAVSWIFDVLPADELNLGQKLVCTFQHHGFRWPGGIDNVGWRVNDKGWTELYTPDGRAHPRVFVRRDAEKVAAADRHTRIRHDEGSQDYEIGLREYSARELGFKL